MFADMPRFVLLTHDHPFVHWDLLLEDVETARTWRLLECPARWLVDPSIAIVAEAIGDHRRMYLDYEGPVSRERGHVVRWDHGQAEWLTESESSVRVRLSGSRLVGELVLDRETSQPLWSARFSLSVGV
ncbi:MAG: hypothetical protein DWI21_12245 [Planctomycetota bacterium]|nr:MAG: hypothetical protein DWI21_12245 [Planctomycetota bacterium]